MYKSIFFLGICSAFALGKKLPVPDKKFEKIVSCYYQAQSDIFKDTKLSLQIDDIDVSLCTHITFSSIELNADASLANYCEVNINDKDTRKSIEKFIDLRKKKPNLKTLVTLEATGEDADYFANSTNAVTNPILREKVVNTLLEVVKKFKFNGLDIIWENTVRTPASQVKAASDKQNFVLLLKALREKFDKEGLILSVTVRPIEEIAKLSYNIKEISKYVDFINLQTYDFDDYNDLGKKVTHPTPIYPSSKENAEESKFNINYIVKYWISQGAPPRKLILGTSSVAKSFTLANPKKVGRGAPSLRPGDIKEITLIHEYPNYHAVCVLLKNHPEWRHIYDKEQQTPYIYNGDLILAYDDVESMKKKAEYVNKMNLGGVFLSHIDEDDFNGKCGEKFPLLKTLNRVLGYKC